MTCIHCKAAREAFRKVIAVGSRADFKSAVGESIRVGRLLVEKVEADRVRQRLKREISSSSKR